MPLYHSAKRSVVDMVSAEAAATPEGLIDGENVDGMNFLMAEGREARAMVTQGTGLAAAGLSAARGANRQHFAPTLMKLLLAGLALVAAVSACDQAACSAAGRALNVCTPESTVCTDDCLDAIQVFLDVRFAVPLRGRRSRSPLQ